MIVIATNNGHEFLPRLLESIERHGTDNHKICIIDTGSTDEVFIKYLDSLDKFKYIIDKTPYKGYDTGAYIYAYRKYNVEEYLFMHDSLEVLTDDWISEFKAMKTDVCYYVAFESQNRFPEQKPFLMDIGVYNPNSTHSVFGPIFYVKREVLDAINQRFNLDAVIPSNKKQQMGMELGWAMMIDSVTSSVSWLGSFEAWLSQRGWAENPTIMYKNLRKHRPVRK